MNLKTLEIGYLLYFIGVMLMAEAGLTFWQGFWVFVSVAAGANLERRANEN